MLPILLHVLLPLEVSFFILVALVVLIETTLVVPVVVFVVKLAAAGLFVEEFAAATTNAVRRVIIVAPTGIAALVISASHFVLSPLAVYSVAALLKLIRVFSIAPLAFRICRSRARVRFHALSSVVQISLVVAATVSLLYLRIRRLEVVIQAALILVKR